MTVRGVAGGTGGGPGGGVTSVTAGNEFVTVSPTTGDVVVYGVDQSGGEAGVTTVTSANALLTAAPTSGNVVLTSLAAYFHGTYSGAVTYPINAIVIGPDDATYISLQNSNTNHTPADSPTFWQLISSPPAEAGVTSVTSANALITVSPTTGAVVVTGLSSYWAGTYAAETTYPINAIIIGADGGTYISLQSGNVGHTPASSPTFWQLLASPPGEGGGFDLDAADESVVVTGTSSAGTIRGNITAHVTASEALAAGDWVNIWNSSGAKVRKARADLGQGYAAHGYVVAAVASSGDALVFMNGVNTHCSGLTPGEVFLSATPGLATNTPVETIGYISQQLGVAFSATAVGFEPHPDILLGDMPVPGGTTWDPDCHGTAITFSNDDRTITYSPAGTSNGARSVSGKTEGRFYVEFVGIVDHTTNTPRLGLAQSSSIVGCTENLFFGNPYVGGQRGWALFTGTGPNRTFKSFRTEPTSAGEVTPDPTEVCASETLTTDVTVFQMAVDFDAQKLWFGRNNTWYFSGNPAAGTNASFTNVDAVTYGPLHVAMAFGSAGALTAHFGEEDWVYAPPSGFGEWT